MVGEYVVVGGWKPVSLIDMPGFVAGVLWFCGCNMRCPFCHNWRIATGDREVCRRIPVDTVVEWIGSAAEYIDYVHVTGGEPLLQYIGLRKVFIGAREHGVKVSLDSNLWLSDRLAYVLDAVDHIATDLKLPLELMTGLRDDLIQWYWRGYTGSLELVARERPEIRFELRVPVIRETPEAVRTVLPRLTRVLSRLENLYVQVFPVLGEPLLTPRDNEWVQEHRATRRDVEDVARYLGEVLGVPVQTRYLEILGFDGG